MQDENLKSIGTLAAKAQLTVPGGLIREREGRGVLGLSREGETTLAQVYKQVRVLYRHRVELWRSPRPRSVDFPVNTVVCESRVAVAARLQTLSSFKAKQSRDIRAAAGTRTLTANL